MKKEILYCGVKTAVECDGLCTKAWGISNRPYLKISDKEDDIAYLADEELKEAPVDPGTYEGGVGKPTSNKDFPNKWCVRECERCNFIDYPKKDFSERVYNIER